MKKLGELLVFKNGINATKEQYGRGVKFVNVSDILNNDFLTYENISGSVDVDHSTLDKYSVEYGDILFQRSSETREEVGTANVYLDREKIATFGGFVIRGKKNGIYDPLYFNNLLKSDIARNSITSRSGGSTRYNVGQEILFSVELSFPFLSEQEKIGRFMSLLDERIQTQNKIIEQLESSIVNFRKKLFSEQIGLREKKESLTTKWETRTLENIVTKKSSNISANKIEDNVGDYIIYGASGILKKVDFYKEEDDYISIIKDGAGVGRLFYCKGKSSVLGTMDIIQPKDGINAYFLFHLLSCIDFTKYISGSTIPHIYFKDYKNERCNIPSLKMQTFIANFLLSISNKIEVEKQLLLKYENQKKHLLQNLFI